MLNRLVLMRYVGPKDQIYIAKIYLVIGIFSGVNRDSEKIIVGLICCSWLCPSFKALII